MKSITALGDAHVQRVLDDYPFTLVCRFRQDKDSFYLVREVERLMAMHQDDTTVVCFIETPRTDTSPTDTVPVLLFYKGNEERGRATHTTSAHALFGILSTLKRE